MMTSTLLVLLLLSQAEGPDDPPAGTMGPPLPPSMAGGWHYLTRLDASGLALLPSGEAAGVDSYVQLTPMLVLDGGEALGLNLGAPVRLRVGGGDPGAGLVRGEDWDSLSDWGQLVRALKLGSDASSVGLWAGALDSYSLLSGHLVRRYSNRANPDYHPAGAFLTSLLGPLYAEAFSSDVLGARLMGAEVALDLAHLFTGPQEEPGRYTLALSAVHDWGRAGGHSPQVTLTHLDGTAVVVVRPDYELARFRAAGPSGLPVVEAPFPDGFSVYGEAVVGWDAVRLGGLRQRHLHLSLAVEAFTWGRVDVDGRLAAQLAERRVEVAVSALATGVGKPGARYLYSGEVRWRFGGWLYAVGQGGTLLFPAPDGALHPGAFASLGLGVDHAR